MKTLDFQTKNSIEICYRGSDWQLINTGLGNDRAPNRIQAITSTNDGLAYWRIYATLGLNGFTRIFQHDF